MTLAGPRTVARAGDVGSPAGAVVDGLADFLIAAPGTGADAGRVYLIFGDGGLDELGTCDAGDRAGLACGSDQDCPDEASFDNCTVPPLDIDQVASCAVPTLCGVIFEGETADDEAGFSASFAGDINDDGNDDILAARRRLRS